MAVRLRNLSNIIQTITIVRPQQTYSKSVNPKCFVHLQDDEYSFITPPLKSGVWHVETIQKEVSVPTCAPEIPCVSSAEGEVPSQVNAASSEWTTLIKTTSYGIANKEEVFFDTSESPLTVLLPTNAELGWRVRVSDYAGTWFKHPLTVLGNGAKINGGFSNLILTKKHMHLELVYLDAVQGWAVPVD